MIFGKRELRVLGKEIISLFPTRGIVVSIGAPPFSQLCVCVCVCVHYFKRSILVLKWIVIIATLMVALSHNLIIDWGGTWCYIPLPLKRNTILGVYHP